MNSCPMDSYSHTDVMSHAKDHDLSSTKLKIEVGDCRFSLKKGLPYSEITPF